MNNRILLSGLVLALYISSGTNANAALQSTCPVFNANMFATPSHRMTWSNFDELIYNHYHATQTITAWPPGTTVFNNPALTDGATASAPFNTVWQSLIPGPFAGFYSWEGGGLLTGIIILSSPPYWQFLMSNPSSCDNTFPYSF